MSSEPSLFTEGTNVCLLNLKIGQLDSFLEKENFLLRETGGSEKEARLYQTMGCKKEIGGNNQESWGVKNYIPFGTLTLFLLNP